MTDAGMSSTGTAGRGLDCLDELLIDLLGAPLGRDGGIMRRWVDACCQCLCMRAAPVRARGLTCMADKLIREEFWSADPAARPALMARLELCCVATRDQWQRTMAAAAKGTR